VCTLLKRLLQPGKGVVVLAKVGIDKGHAIRRDIAVLGQLVQLSEHAVRFGGLP